MSANKDLLQVINSSGFPLQIAVAHAVETGGVAWRVMHREHAWANATDGLSGFIDLVLQSTETDDSLVVECKRVQNAAWLFLSHSGQSRPRAHCKAWATAFKSEQPNPTFFGWADLPLPLQSHEAQFCCLRGQSSNDKNTFLERIAGELVSSTEALAREERDVRPSARESCHLYFNVLVTTAQLYFTSYDKASLRLEEGVLAEARFERVPYVRVRKQFSMRPFTLSPADWHRQDDSDYRRENTILVVKAAQLLQFLRDFKPNDIPLGSIGA